VPPLRPGLAAQVTTATNTRTVRERPDAPDEPDAGARAYPGRAVGVISPTNAAKFITGGAGVVAALGTATGWLGRHGSADLVYYVGLGLLAVGAVVVWVFHFWLLKGRRAWHWWAYIAVMLAVMFLTIAVVRTHATHDVTDYVMAYVYAGLGAIPVFWVSFQWDNANHKECRMCCERIKAKARICRHCGTLVADATTYPSGRAPASTR
jgi:hypothetical protein